MSNRQCEFNKEATLEFLEACAISVLSLPVSLLLWPLLHLELPLVWEVLIMSVCASLGSVLLLLSRPLLRCLLRLLLRPMEEPLERLPEPEFPRTKPFLIFITKSKGENWATSLGWFIPRRYRNDIIGDILEDCAEMRELGYMERQIKFHVVYQWLIAVITLVPMAVKTSITDILKHVLSPPR
jgi:hypothetical protein